MASGEEQQSTDSAPWRQGSIAGPEVVHALHAASVDRLPHIEWDHAHLVVISQDCDICHDVDEEPFVDLLPFVVLIDRTPHQVNEDNLCRNGRNPRRLVLALPQIGEAATKQWHRVRLPKSDLEGRNPVATLDPAALLCMRRWLGRRYTRAAFPDNFNRRIEADKKHARKIDGLWKKSTADQVTGVYILCPETEITDAAVDYEIRIVCTYPPKLDENGHPIIDPVTGELVFDVEVVKHAEEVAGNLDDWMGDIAGIEVLSAKAMPEVDFSLSDLRSYKRLELDFRSGTNHAASLPLGVEAP